MAEMSFLCYYMKKKRKKELKMTKLRALKTIGQAVGIVPKKRNTISMAFRKYHTGPKGGKYYITASGTKCYK